MLHFATSGEEALDHLAGHIQRQRQSEMPLAFGIGLNCGAGVVGDLGSDQSLWWGPGLWVWT